MSTVKIPVIEPTSSIKIEVDGSFYSLACEAYLAFATSMKQEKFQELIVAIKEEKENRLSSDVDKKNAVILRVLMSVIIEVEKEFGNAGLINEKEVELPNEG